MIYTIKECFLWGHCSFLLGPGAHKFPSTIVWPHIKQQEGKIAPPITENWIKDLLNRALPIRTIPSFPLSQSFPSESFHKPVIYIHQRADTIKTTITED